MSYELILGQCEVFAIPEKINKGLIKFSWKGYHKLLKL